MEVLLRNISDTKSLKRDSNLTCDFTKDVHGWTDDEITKEMFYTTIETVKTIVIVPILFIVGFLGNSAFFLLLARVKMMRTLTNFYLANLAIADMTVLLVKTWYHSASYLKSAVVWSEPFSTNTGCILNTFVLSLSYCASVLLITFISLDRYFAVCRPVQYRFMKNKKHAICIFNFTVWLLSAMYALPIFPRFGRLVYECIIWPPREKYRNFPVYGQYCVPLHAVFENVFYVLATIPFFAALIANTILYIKIVKKLKQPLGENRINPTHNIKQRVTWMLLANSVIFFCCLAPS